VKNKLTDLNDHLFEMLERLNDEDLSGERLKQEVTRAGAMVAVSKQIIDNASLTVRAFEIIGGNVDVVTNRIGMVQCLA